MAEKILKKAKFNLGALLLLMIRFEEANKRPMRWRVVKREKNATHIKIEEDEKALEKTYNLMILKGEIKEESEGSSGVNKGRGGRNAEKN